MVLDALAGMMKSDETPEESQNKSTPLPSELDLAGKTLMVSKTHCCFSL